MPEECGILKVGPSSCKRVTVKSTLFCSAGLRPSHQRPNSVVNSTSHGTSTICHLRHYAVNGIILDRWHRTVAPTVAGSIPVSHPRFFRCFDQLPSLLLLALEP